MKRDREAFTLIELLSVVAIIAILLGIIIGVWKYAQDAAFRKRAIAQIMEIQGAIVEYKVKYGGIPPDIKATSISLREGFTYSNGAPIDPWGQEYQYEHAGESYRVFSKGPDKATGSTNSGDDIEFKK